MNININYPGASPYSPMMGGGFPSFAPNPMQVMGMMLQLMQTMLTGMMGGGAMMGGYPGFGGSNFGSPASFGGGGLPGASSFLGGSGGGGGGGGSTSAASGPTVDPSTIKGTGWGADLARYAGSHANGPGGYCYKWVGQALSKFGVNVHGASAYMAADQLAKNPKFREVQVNPKDFAKLPAGAVVVWNRGNGHQHGHISIALGNGKEASDKLRNQITNYGTSARVFLPK